MRKRSSGWLTVSVTLLLGGALPACTLSSRGAADGASSSAGGGMSAGGTTSTGDSGPSGGETTGSAMPGVGGGTTGGGGTGGGAPVSTARVVAYLPTYSGSYGDWATRST